MIKFILPFVIVAGLAVGGGGARAEGGVRGT